MDKTGSLKDYVQEMRGKATGVRGSGNTCNLGMEEEEKLSRDKQERLRSWNSREKSGFQNWGVNNTKCYRDVRKNQSPTIPRVKYAKAQGTRLNTNHPQTKHYYFE